MSVLTLDVPLVSSEDRSCLPRVRLVHQIFERVGIGDTDAAVRSQVDNEDLRGRVRPGQSIAIAVGSRGIAEYARVIATVVDVLRGWGAEPFIVPAMGAHGGGTPAGQRAVLIEHGISEESVGAPIRATMDVVEIGRLDDGSRVFLDALAFEADGIVAINRIKPHTLFRGRVESGVCKLLAAGLGNAAGVASLHGSTSPLGEVIAASAELLVSKVPVLFGLALLENGYGELAHVEAIAAERLVEREPALLARARELLPRLYFDELDVLVLEQIGKDISGQGLDPNVTGRNARSVLVGDGPTIEKIVALDLSPRSRGNAAGIGQLDVVSADLMRRVDFAVTYKNVITAMLPDLAALPLVARTHADAIAIAIQTARRRADDVRLVLARDTKHLSELWVSEALFSHVARHPKLEFAGPEGHLLAGDELVSLLHQSSGAVP